MTLSEYEQLKQYLTEQYVVGTGARHNEILSSLKETYRDNINSTRRFEQIHSIGQLLRVLEIRDLLSEDKVDCLKNIATKLPNSRDVLKTINHYESMHVPREQGNYYTSSPHNSIKKEQEIEESYFNSSPISNGISKKKRQLILQTIVEEIGSHWRDLGRNLNIRECTIDEIDVENKLFVLKATKLLEKYEERADPQRWFFFLCDALERSRRKDLVRAIQDIMTRNI